jgi:hypothetical protein
MLREIACFATRDNSSISVEVSAFARPRLREREEPIGRLSIGRQKLENDNSNTATA